jgi:hypothetical protein
LKRLHPLTEQGDLLRKLLRLGGCHLIVHPVGLIRSVQIACDARLDPCHLPGQLGAGEVALLTVDGLELGAIQRNLAAGEQTEPATQDHELIASGADALSVVTPEVSNGLEVGRELSGEPDQLEIAAGLLLEPPA